VTLFNDGNTKFNKPVQIRLLNSGDGTPDSGDETIVTLRRRATVQPGSVKPLN